MFVDITPLDTIFVRDSRRFGTNEGHAVDSIFPPPPSVCFGAWRGAVLMSGGYKVCKWGRGGDRNKEKTSNGKKWPAWFGGGDDAGSFRQKGPAIFYNNDTLFPLPFDAILKNSSKIQSFSVIRVPERENSLPTPYYLRLPQGLGRLPKVKGLHLITGTRLSEYLGMPWGNGETIDTSEEKNKNIYSASEIWSSERRINVGIDSVTYAGEEGKLFSLGHIRTCPGVSFRCDWNMKSGNGRDEPIDLVKTGKIKIVNLGGEKRPARLGVISPSSFNWPGGPAKSELEACTRHGKTCFRIYFATPAYFEGGWEPVQGDRHVLKTEGLEVPVKLLAAAVGKPFSLGGYDIEAQGERSIRKFVPAGSVFYFQGEAERLDDIIKLHASTIGDNEFLRNQGFGLAFAGACNPGIFSS
jgi:CRISPR-associated protein Cmr3